jgi:hypothetical protein
VDNPVEKVWMISNKVLDVYPHTAFVLMSLFPQPVDTLISKFPYLAGPAVFPHIHRLYYDYYILNSYKEMGRK